MIADFKFSQLSNVHNVGIQCSIHKNVMGLLKSTFLTTHPALVILPWPGSYVPHVYTPLPSDSPPANITSLQSHLIHNPPDGGSMLFQ